MLATALGMVPVIRNGKSKCVLPSYSVTVSGRSCSSSKNCLLLIFTVTSRFSEDKNMQRQANVGERAVHFNSLTATFFHSGADQRGPSCPRSCLGPTLSAASGIDTNTLSHRLYVLRLRSSAKVVAAVQRLWHLRRHRVQLRKNQKSISFI